jgi:hypothetical protein
MRAAHHQVLYNQPRLGNVGYFVAPPLPQTKPLPDKQAKLILQDSRVWEQAQTPALKASGEISSNSPGQLDAATAQQTWQAAQLSTEEVAEKLAQLRAADANNQKANQKIQVLQTESTTLRQQVQHYERQSWQQPAMYAAGALALGAGWLWLSERKQRLRAQEHVALLHNEANSVLAMPEGPQFNFSEPFYEKPKIQDVISDPIADSILPEDLLPYAPTVSAPKPVATPEQVAPAKPAVAKLESGQATAPWWKLSKKKTGSTLLSVSPSDSRSQRSGSQSHTQSTQFDPYDELAELDELDLVQQNGQDPASATIELLSQTRIKPVSSEDAMGHLLELRMAVQALCAIRQTDAAIGLLLQHIEAVPNTCAWAYVEYLHLCSELGRRDDFEAMRKRYRLQFNRLAPYWLEPNSSVQTLDSYDRPMYELCAAWPKQEQAKLLLSTWLLGNLHSRRLFQLPAYHDLLDLYAMLEFYDGYPVGATEFVPTVSLLDLDYEFAVEVTIDAVSEQDALRAIPAVKTGDFAVDVDLAQNPTQHGSLTAIVDSPKPGSPASRP